LYQPLEAFSPAVIEATILYEDKDFYAHSGVDVSAIIRAGWDTYVKRSRRVGASTITMQLARLGWNISSNSLSGKVEQILRSIQLSRHYSKDQILELYLNLAPYGRNIEGLAAASLIYFNKKPSELSLPEALTLAVIPQNPNKRNPTKASNFKELSSARSRLLGRWLESHPNDAAQAGQFDLPLAAGSPEQLPRLAPHFVQFVNQQRSQWDNGYTNTTLDSKKQSNLEQVLKNYVSSKRNIGINNASALLLNYQTMSIEAMVGSADFNNASIQGQVNAATAKRSPGSTLKPFVYGLALDEGLIHPLSLLKDSPRRFGGFTPQNYDKQFWGPVSATKALIESRNVPAVNLQAQLKQKSFHQFLVDADISNLKDESHYGLALALGGGELTMLELASLYAMAANRGELKEINSVLSAPKSNKSVKRILSEEASFLILDMLKDNPMPEQLAMKANERRNQVAWKTGTSWAFRDAWAVGVSGPYVMVVWVGNFDGKGNESFIGRSAAGPLLFSMFRSVNDDIAWQVEDAFAIELMNLKKLDVCSETGDLYEKHCRSASKTWFIPGTSPIKVSNIYRAIPIDKESGLRACSHRYGISEMEIFEFWPSDFLQIFNQAGVSLKTPPAYEPSCNLTDKSASGQVPVITSPQATVEYAIRMEYEQDRQIPLKAVVDGNVSKLHWFIDDSYIGSVNNDEPLFWRANAGQFNVKAVDDSGRSASKKFIVKQVH
jgi:penicillin-binding protein 1C